MGFKLTTDILQVSCNTQCAKSPLRLDLNIEPPDKKPHTVKQRSKENWVCALYESGYQRNKIYYKTTLIDRMIR